MRSKGENKSNRSCRSKVEYDGRDAEEERQDFIDFFKGKILKKEVNIALFSLETMAKKNKRRVIPGVTGLTREKLINNKF